MILVIIHLITSCRSDQKSELSGLEQEKVNLILILYNYRDSNDTKFPESVDGLLKWHIGHAGDKSISHIKYGWIYKKPPKSSVNDPDFVILEKSTSGGDIVRIRIKDLQ